MCGGLGADSGSLQSQLHLIAALRQKLHHACAVAVSMHETLVPSEVRKRAGQNGGEALAVLLRTSCGFIHAVSR